MRNIKKLARELYLERIKNATSYTGSLKQGDKVISASSVFSDDLPLYLKVKHGVPDKWKFQGNTIGTLYHMGMDMAFESHSVSKRLTMPINDEWTLSGEYDLVLEVVDTDDEKFYCIIDHKLSKDRTVTEVNKQKGEHDYVRQLRIYKRLLTYNEPEKYTNDNVKMFLAVAIKDATLFNEKPIPDFEFMEVSDDTTDDELMEKLIEKAERIQMHLDSNIEPEQCATLFWYKKAGEEKKTPMKCIHYCDFVEVCKFGKRFLYKEKTRGVSAFMQKHMAKAKTSVQKDRRL